MTQDSTIYDIAAKAGVSASTVSRVINNYPYVNKDTRAKVLKVIAESNYIKNDSARSLATQSTKMAGILIADVRTTHHTEGVYYVEHEFSKNGYSCLIYNTGTDPDQQAKYIHLLSQRKVEAVVLMGSVFQNVTVQNAIMVNLPNTPVAICNGYLDGQNIYGVTSDEHGGVMNSVKLLAGKGHKNFVFITNKLTPSNQEKVNGFNDGLKLYVEGGSSEVIEVKSGEVSDFEDATRQVMRSKPNTDAIIYSEDFIALAGLHALYEMGINVPGQVAVVGMNNSRYAQISNPALTSIDNMLYDTSLIAVRNLLEVLKGERVNHKMSIGSEVVERSST
ncbi:MAG: LacI family DNA-binding transcriptional regulator [Spirochaetales bacterium]|nr:LacI family DNA-binding transcriptional regulator [Spirochaetales bacterium]MBR5097800.1 LacI family DNA-binding transcriptional regulator [Spirochaetales bacterium]